MVAISLYRGNLHRVPDIPRRWVMPRPRISVKEFRGLLRRRSKAFSLLKAGEALASASVPSTIQNGNPPPPTPSLPPALPPPPKQKHRRPDRQIDEEDVKPGVQDLTFPVPSGVNNSEGNVNQEEPKAEDVGAEELQQLVDIVLLVEGKVEVVSGDPEEEERKNEDPDAVEANHKVGISDDKERRKKEVEEKLEILNKKKHKLVQALKQISSVEEELKRRSNMQPTRPSVSLQVDMSNDSGSMTRVATPRIASEANAAQRGEADSVFKNDLQSRQAPGMSSMSPSAESALKRPSYFSA